MFRHVFPNNETPLAAYRTNNADLVFANKMAHTTANLFTYDKAAALKAQQAAAPCMWRDYSVGDWLPASAPREAYSINTTKVACNIYGDPQPPWLFDWVPFRTGCPVPWLDLVHLNKRFCQRIIWFIL